ncbi:enoyl-CoA hydratase-related protein [Flexivirga alba]|uniref:Enoyl-CoA hydratase-related protein n=1 Tax=Flexivirga alba TaxID=702742 RepID=A0ABW2AJX6_9MICO
MTFETIEQDVDDGVLTITLHRPDQLNAFTVGMADELEATFRAVNDDDTVRAVIVTGAGRAFCAGMALSTEGNVFGLDEGRAPALTDMSDLSDPSLARIRDTGGRVTLAIHDCTKPVIAAINGPAVGIGATMTLAMDARLVSTKARFGLVFGRLGIVPEAASSWFLPRIVGLPARWTWPCRRTFWTPPRQSKTVWRQRHTSQMNSYRRRAISRTAGPRAVPLSQSR